MTRREKSLSLLRLHPSSFHYLRDDFFFLFLIFLFLPFAMGIDGDAFHLLYSFLLRIFLLRHFSFEVEMVRSSSTSIVGPDRLTDRRTKPLIELFLVLSVASV